MALGLYGFAAFFLLVAKTYYLIKYTYFPYKLIVINIYSSLW